MTLSRLCVMPKIVSRSAHAGACRTMSIAAVSSSSGSSVTQQIETLEEDITKENASKTDNATVKQQKIEQYDMEIEILEDQQQQSSMTSMIDIKA